MSRIESLVGNVAISAVTLAELLAGVGRLPDGRRKQELADAIRFTLMPYVEAGSVLPFDAAAAEYYASILVAREAAGLPISTPDAQIAAICRTHSAVCAARNSKDFAHTGIEVINPGDAS